MSLYNIFILGDGIPGAANKLKRSLRRSFRDLGIQKKHVRFLPASGVISRSRNVPTVAAFLGPSSSAQDTIAASQLIADGVPIVPAVSDLSDFIAHTPGVLRGYNGLQLGASCENLPRLNSAMLEWLGLLRRQRRLFISYRRSDARIAALQLHDRLQEAGFDVFLDTHGIRPADDFQAVLMHRLTDCEVMILIDTPDFLGNRWTVEELARANLLGIAILQVIWPLHAPPRKSPISEKYYLNPRDVLGGTGPLSDSTVECLVNTVEALRSSALATRTAALAGEFQMQATRAGARVFPEANRTLRAELADGRTLIAVPTIGVPTAHQYYELSEVLGTIAEEIPVLVYEHLGILQRWLNHLDWLNAHLPVKTLKATDIYTRLR